jgi:hypothetical protein
VRHLRDWKAGFERSGRDLDSPVGAGIKADLQALPHSEPH